MAFMAFYGHGDAVNIKRRRLKQAMAKKSGYNQLIYSRHENAEVCGIDRAKGFNVMKHHLPLKLPSHS